MTENPAAGRAPDVMGGPDPDEQDTDVMDGADPDEHTDAMDGPDRGNDRPANE